MKNREKLIKRALQIIFAITGALLAAFYLAPFTSMYLMQMGWTPQHVLMVQTGVIVVLALLGFLIAGPIVNRIIFATLQGEKHLQKMSAGDLIGGIIGLILGLIVAFFIGTALSFIPIIGAWISLAAYIIFGYLGISLGIKKRGDFLNLLGNLGREGGSRLRKGNKPRAAGYCNMPKVLDTSVIIDGRIADICKTGFVEGPLIIPNFVLEELRHISDSSDALKRAKGRRGLDMLNVIRTQLDIEVEISDKDYPDIAEVDDKLVQLALDLFGCVVTNDYNLNKVATLKGVIVLNINELANAIKPVVLPGERMHVTVVKEGKEHNQGVAYLDDGTMIVVENGRNYLGEYIEIEVTSVIQTNAGRMIFGKPVEKNTKLY